MIDPCVCVCVIYAVHYSISITVWKLRLTDIHNTYHANEKMFWGWTPDYPCGLASPTLLQVAVCCLDGVATIIIPKIILICNLNSAGSNRVYGGLLKIYLTSDYQLLNGGLHFTTTQSGDYHLLKKDLLHNYLTRWLSASQGGLCPTKT
jgi:hypothetical protein